MPIADPPQAREALLDERLPETKAFPEAAIPFALPPVLPAILLLHTLFTIVLSLPVSMPVAARSPVPPKLEEATFPER